MNNQFDVLDNIFNEKNGNDKYRAFHLNFNPFPRSGTSNINGSDSLNQSLIPVNKSVLSKLTDYIKQALTENPLDEKDKLLTITITGNYGAGKTQILMFVKSILKEVATRHTRDKVPYVIYIDRPGVKLLDFIGFIISKIGEENFKKYIWYKIIKEIRNNQNYKNRLMKFERQGSFKFAGMDSDPYSEENSVSYKKFLDAFTLSINSPKERKDFDETFRNILIEILDRDIRDFTISEYFYELISSDFGANKTWEALSTGSIKQLDGKEVQIIRYVVRLIKEQGYTDFFILVDEFEDLTKGRLNKTQIDNYIYNLRTLLDEHREWSLLFSMTGEALKQLRSISPPLADRITNHLLNLQNLNTEEASKVVTNYLNIARDEQSDDLEPFDLSGVATLNDLIDGNTRKFLKNCFYMVEKLAENPKEGIINSEFIKKYYSKESNLS